MKVRFQGDADLDARIIRGVKRRQPSVGFHTAAEAGLTGVSDPDVLLIAAEMGRILVTHDQRTMPNHLGQFMAQRPSAGVALGG